MKKVFLILLGLTQIASMYSQQLTIIPNSETGNDSYIWSAGPMSNYGENNSIFTYTWTNGGDVANIRGLLKFDLSDLPEGSVIEDAFLSLYWNPTETTNNVNIHSGQNAFWIERAISPWHESNLSWSNQPQTTQQNRVLVPKSSTENQDYPNIEVTELINDMLEYPNEAYGFMFKMEDENTPYSNVVFASSEHSNENLRPRLVINYSNPNDNCFKIRPNLSEGQDSYIWSHGLSSNYGDNQSIHAYTWTNGGDLALIRGFINFDFENIPSGSVIESAKLSLFYNPNSTVPGVNVHSGDNRFWIERITSSWDENILNWSNQPSSTTENRVGVDQSIVENQDYLDIDVTNLLNDILDNPSEGFGFLLKMQNESTPYANVIFASNNHPNSVLHPLLEVCLSPIVSSAKNQELADPIKMFPNPSREVVSFENIPKDYSKLIIRNTNGSMLKSMTLSESGDQINVNINFLASGIYFVEIISKQQEVKLFKLIKP